LTFGAEAEVQSDNTRCIYVRLKAYMLGQMCEQAHSNELSLFPFN